MIDGLIDCLIDWLIGRFIGYLPESPTNAQPQAILHIQPIIRKTMVDSCMIPTKQLTHRMEVRSMSVVSRRVRKKAIRPDITVPVKIQTAKWDQNPSYGILSMSIVVGKLQWVTERNPPKEKEDGGCKSWFYHSNLRTLHSLCNPCPYGNDIVYATYEDVRSLLYVFMSVVKFSWPGAKH